MKSDEENLQDKHIGALIPAHPNLTLITISWDIDRIVVEQDYVIAWVLDEYTEPAMPITANGHYPNRSDECYLVLLCLDNGKLLVLGSGYNTPNTLEEAIKEFKFKTREQLKELS